MEVVDRHRQFLRHHNILGVVAVQLQKLFHNGEIVNQEMTSAYSAHLLLGIKREVIMSWPIYEILITENLYLPEMVHLPRTM